MSMITAKDDLISANIEYARVGKVAPTSSLNYTIVRLLGKGAFGSVYLATHNLSGRKVAIKSIDQ